MKLADFDYTLPPEQIAQRPHPDRDASRLLVLRRESIPQRTGALAGREPGRGHDVPGAGRTAAISSCAAAEEEDAGATVENRSCRVAGAESAAATAERGTWKYEHAIFRDLDRFLAPGDLLVLNDTRVLPARLIGTKPSGGRIELLLVEPEPPREGIAGGTNGSLATKRVPTGPVDAFRGSGVWHCLAGFSRAPSEGAKLSFDAALDATYIGKGPPGMHRVALASRSSESVRSILERAGRTPLPPYIHRNGETAAVHEDRERYQTVYAANEGAIAAPTAGLHFTAELLDRLAVNGVRVARTTLHVGPATFLPVRTDEIEDHPMSAERYEVSSETAARINETRAQGGRIVAVGTTVVRALETASDGRRGVVPARGRTDLFIYPGYRFRVVDALITNFHLPKSTLLALVAAFAGRERILAAYETALGAGYRFYSYGDAMLIL